MNSILMFILSLENVQPVDTMNTYDFAYLLESRSTANKLNPTCNLKRQLNSANSVSYSIQRAMRSEILFLRIKNIKQIKARSKSRNQELAGMVAKKLIYSRSLKFSLRQH